MTQTVEWKRHLRLMPVVALILIALVLRLAIACGVQNEVSKSPARLCLISGDAEGYWELAGKMAAFKAYSIYDPPRRLLRMPGFPLVLALPRFIFGDRPFAARMMLAFVGTLACGLTYWLGRELAGEVVGLIAGAYTAISPTMVLFSVLFLSETAFAAAMLASLIAAAKLFRDLSDSRQRALIPALDFQGREGPREETATLRERSWKGIWLAIVTGIMVGLATYMRPTWILVGPGLGVCLIVFGRAPTLDRWILAGGICIGLGVTLAPWTIRNYLWTGHFIPTTLWVGPSLYDGLNPAATGDSNMEFFEQDRLLERMSEYQMDREYRRRAWDFAAANPGRVMTLARIKQLRFWSPVPSSPQFRHPGVQTVAWLAFLPLVVFALFGAWFVRHDVWLLILTAAPIFYFAGLHLLFVGSLRYRMPAEYPLAVLAAVGMCRSFRNKSVNQVPMVH